MWSLYNWLASVRLGQSFDQPKYWLSYSCDDILMFHFLINGWLLLPIFLYLLLISIPIVTCSTSIGLLVLAACSCRRSTFQLPKPFCLWLNCPTNATYMPTLAVWTPVLGLLQPITTHLAGFWEPNAVAQAVEENETVFQQGDPGLSLEVCGRFNREKWMINNKNISGNPSYNFIYKPL